MRKVGIGKPEKVVVLKLESLVLRSTDPKMRVKDYLAFCAHNQHILGRKGDVGKGEIQYITSLERILKAEASLTKRARKQDPRSDRIVLAAAIESPFSTFVLHPVLQRQDDGSVTPGCYHQAIWKFEQAGRRGMAVLCLGDDGRVLLNMQFRRPTNQYEWEPPSFSSEPGEEGRICTTIERELREESGAEIAGKVIPLGEYTTDSGMMHLANLLFAAKIKKVMRKGTGVRLEAIRRTRWFTFDEIRHAFKVGKFGGARFRDGRLNALLLQAYFRGVVQLGPSRHGERLRFRARN